MIFNAYCSKITCSTGQPEYSVANNSLSICLYPQNIVIIPLCKRVEAKLTLVPCCVNLKGKRDKGGHGGATINNARIIKLWRQQ